MFGRRVDQSLESNRLKLARTLTSGIVGALVVFGMFQSQATAGSTTTIYNNGTSQNEWVAHSW